MRVLIAPDGFGGTLTSAQAAEAIARGWREGAPGDELAPQPLSDGGPGFVDVLHAALGGTVHQARVTGPLGSPVDAAWLEHGGTAYVESAQACGLALIPAQLRRAGDATSRGVGELVKAALDRGLRRVVVGLGGSASTDGGAGLLAALGSQPVDERGAALPDGGLALARCAALSARPTVALDVPERPTHLPETADTPGVGLIAATDVDSPLVGVRGAAVVFGPQKGADPETVRTLDAALGRWAEVLAAATGRDVRDEPGAGAAGGLGAALLVLGAVRESGAGLVRRLTGLDRALDVADLAVTGEGSFDWQSLRGKLVTAVASGAADRGVPCVVLAGQVAVGRREAASIGVDAAYSTAEHAGSVDASLADPAGTLSALARHVATQWGGRR